MKHDTKWIHIPTVPRLACLVVILSLLCGCLPLRYPSSGQPVVIQPGEALVFGRIHMVNARNAHLEYSPFWPDPWVEPFFGPDPRMTLELRQLNPPNGNFKYKAYPAPAVDKDGSFNWILTAGDYLLLGNPRLLGSKRYDQQDTQALAHFTVPTSGGTVYLGTLVIAIEYDFGDVARSWKKGEAEYAISGSSIVDEYEQGFARLRQLFPVLPQPITRELMRAE